MSNTTLKMYSKLLLGVLVIFSLLTRDGYATAVAQQHPLVGTSGFAHSFNCDLPPVLEPKDGLPSAKELFSSTAALQKQIQRHGAIVRVPTICYDDLGDFDSDERWDVFYQLHLVLQELYPSVHARMELRKINTFGLVYTINGTNTDLKPLLLTAHQDVVPVADASTWTYPPFEAHYDGDWLWGRGASDDKNSLTGVMSALETLLSNETWIPRRTVILAFGFDEECGGLRGANHISQDLQDIYGPEGIAMILDEGGMGIKQLGNTLYAMPAVMEKGHVDIWYELHVAGGHSSIPFPHTGIGIISEVVQALEAHPYEPELRPESPLFQHLVCQARYTPSAQPRITDLVRAGNLEGLQDELISMGRTTQYRMQTSQSVDILRAGQKINAMPEVVVLGVNYRVAPQDSIVDIQHKSVHVIRGIAEKYGIKVRAFEGDEEYAAYSGGKVEGDAINFRAQETIDYNATLVITASQKTYVTAISPTTGPIWDLFSGTLQHTFAFDGGRVVPVGELMTGNTDGRYYQRVTPHVYRFVPLREDWRMNAHTVDERIKMEGHMEILRFYYDLVRNFDASHA